MIEKASDILTEIEWSQVWVSAIDGSCPKLVQLSCLLTVKKMWKERVWMKLSKIDNATSECCWLLVECNRSQ